MRVRFSPHDRFHIRLAVQRAAGEQLDDAHRLRRAIFEDIRREVPVFSLDWAADDVGLILKLPYESQPSWRSPACAPVPERALFIAFLGSVAREHVEHVDVLALLPWILSPLLYGLPTRWCDLYDQLADEPARQRYELAKAELIEPYIHNLYPVIHGDVFGQFHRLSWRKRELLRLLRGRAQLDMRRALSFYDRPLRTGSPIRRLWGELIEQLIAEGWARPLDESAQTNIIFHHIGPSGRSMLLPAHAMFV